jgi:hypothetical protein
MAKAQFHKNQRVFVRPVGTWALIEAVRPQWAKGLDEPIRIFYDVGLGRDFGADELVGESVGGSIDAGESWRVVRARNKWQPNEDCGHHPHPGTYPVIVTGDTDWGGWRVPGAEYDLYPDRIEAQAQIMANALRMFNLISKLVTELERTDENVSEDLIAIAREAKEILRVASPQEKKS